MVKMPNLQRQQCDRSLFWPAMSLILATIQCLSTTYITIAQESPTDAQAIPSATPQTPASSLGKIHSGNQISLNGRTLPGAWLQRPGVANQVTTHISDGSLRQLIGIDLLNSSNPSIQPIEWFSSTKRSLLPTKLLGGYRYLDITKLAQTVGWQMQINGNILLITTPPTQVKNIRQSQPTKSTSVASLQETRIVVDLDRPTPWQIKQELPVKKTADPDAPTPQPSAPPNKEWTITLDGIADRALIERYTPLPATPPNPLKQLPTTATPQALIQKVEVVNNQTLIRLSVPYGLSPRISTTGNPDRLIIDLRVEAIAQRDIIWASGLRWRQQFFNLGKERFPIFWLEINPRTVGLTLKPIWTTPETLVGTAPIIQTAQKYLAAAAINGGYFNRNNRLPLGAIRRDSQWLSSPILNRGAIAWNDSGQFYFGRLTLEETLIASNNVRSSILFLNSGYVQSGIARYTPVWGQSYTPLTDNEVILVVQKDQITNQLPGGKVGQTKLSIPQDGYLLTLRGNATTTASQLPIGTTIRITTTTTPTDFNRYPHIIGAGPLLVQNSQIVLNAKGEKFSDAFIREKAIRSGICTTASGTLLIAAVHERTAGAGPNLAEHAQLMKLLGCVNALNLDGGSSTSLYLGGQLLNRSPNTAARVHNGIGIFLQRP